MKQFLTLKDHVYNYIAEQITSGTLKPNEKINEGIISKTLNISRTPVREALIQLSAEGLLENTPRKGFVIKQMDINEAAEIYEIIGLLDGLAAELACPLLTKKDFKDLNFYIESMTLAIESENFEMYYKCQKDFHNVYLNHCPNENLVNLQEQLKKKFLRHTYTGDNIETIKSILFSTNDEHKEIFSLLSNNKGKEANEFLKNVHWAPEKANLESL